MSVANLDLPYLFWVQVLQVTAVAVLAAVVVRLACRRRPHLAYLVWMLVIVKALTPPIVASPTGVFSWALRDEPTPVAPAAAMPAPVRIELSADATTNPEPVEPVAAAAPVASPRETPTWPTPAQWLLGGWLIGALALAAFVAFKWIVWRRRWAAAALATPRWLHDRIAEMASKLGLRRPVRVLVSRAATSPAVFGALRPTLLLPASLIEAEGKDGRATVGTSSHAALDLILAHELIHVRRGDVLAAVVQLFAQVVWWFHPLVWWANREARRERERACDEEVVVAIACRATDYARVLLDVLEAQVRPLPAPVVPGVGMLGVTARRLHHLLRDADRFHARTPRGYYALVALAVCLILPGAGLRGAASQPPENETDATAETSNADGDLVQFQEASPRPTGRVYRVFRPDDEGAEPIAEDSPAGRAMARLREAGAYVYEPAANRQQGPLSVVLHRQFRGTADDVALIAQLPDVGNLQVDLRRVDAAALARLKLDRPLSVLTLDGASDANLAAIDALPACRTLQMFDADLTVAGCRRLVELAPQIKALILVGAYKNQGRIPLIPGGDLGDKTPPPPAYVNDEALAAIATLAELRSLQLTNVAATDTGLAQLARMPKLNTLVLFTCPGIHGTGLAGFATGGLQSLTIVDTPISAAGLQTIAKLRGLRQLQLHPMDFGPDDLAPLAALAQLQQLTVTRNWSAQEGMKDFALGDALLRIAARLPELRQLAVTGTPTSDAGLEPLTARSGLLALSLHPVRVTDRSMELVGRIGSLRNLTLGGESTLTDAGLAHAANLAQLQSLTLPGDYLTDDGLRHLAGLTELTRLDLPNARGITGAGLDALARCTKLSRLALVMSGVDDEGSRAVARRTSVQELDLGHSQITDAATPNLAKLDKLLALNLSHTEIGDAALPPLGELKRLQQLNLGGTEVTDKGLETLRRELPRTLIASGAQNDWASFEPFGLEIDGSVEPADDPPEQAPGDKP